MPERIKTILLFVLLSATLPVFPQRPVVGAFHVYYGNLHNHSDLSDGTGTCVQAYDYAKNVSHLDFFSLADHCTLLSATDWARMRTVADSMNEDGVFTAFWGFEWSSTSLYGHVAVIGTEDYCSALSLNTGTFSALCDWLNVRNGLAFFNHPGRENTLGMEFEHFEATPSEKFAGIELWNKGNGFETYYYSDGYDNTDGGLGFYDEALLRGWRAGAGGSEDNHTGDWGFRESKMAILAGDLTRHHLFEAMMQRRFYSTMDPNLMMSFKIHGHEMGSRLPPGTYDGVLELMDGDQEIFVQADIILDGHVVQSFSLNESHPVIPFSIAAEEGQYCYARVRQLDSSEAISSPIFFESAVPVNFLPAVDILYPGQGSSVPSGDLFVQAQAFDAGGQVDRVQFYLDGQFAGSDTTVPFGLLLPGVVPGPHCLSAIAIDNSGAVSPAVIRNFSSNNYASIPPTNAPGNGPQIVISQESGDLLVLVTALTRPAVFELFGPGGSLIISGQVIPGQKTSLSREKLAPGIYWIRLKDQPEVKPVKFFQPGQ